MRVAHLSMPSSTENTAPLDTSDQPHARNEVVVIDSQGDLVLHVNFYEGFSQHYRVSVSALREHSPYFSALLDSTKFSEGIAVESRLTDLRMTHTDMGSVLAAQLPEVSILDVGVGPNTAGPSCEEAFRLCLGILHRSPALLVGNKARIRFIYALLAHYAEAFAVVPAVSAHVESRWPDKSSKSFDPCNMESKENRIRQELYIGLVLGLPSTVSAYSAALIVWGSAIWFEEHEDGSIADTDGYPWDYLGGGVEGE